MLKSPLPTPHSPLPIFLAFLILPAFLFPQDTPNPFSGTIPETLLMPLRGEASRFPRDMVIGTLGQGTAPDAAWRYANNFITALMARQTDNSILTRENSSLLESCLNALDAINPLKYHLGGGRTEPDGTVSFLVRFLGTEQWIAGELYLRPDGNNWRLDDLVLEEARDHIEGNSPYQYNFSPYERFF
jgi:hypothetical protein